MAEKAGFRAEAWKRLRPKVLAGVVEAGEYVTLFAGLLVAHVVKTLIAAAGVDPDIISSVSFMEKWVWIAAFGAFFWRVLLRIWRRPRA
jgi:hypothetical protein